MDQSNGAIEQIPAILTYNLRSEVLYPGRPEIDAVLDNDGDGIHLGLFHKNKIIGVVSLFTRGREMQFRKLAVKEEYQRSGFGKMILEYVVAFARQQGMCRLWCNAREHASGFYAKFGLSKTGPSFNRNGIEYVIMQLSL